MSQQITKSMKNQKNLAWKGTTVAEKQELFERLKAALAKKTGDKDKLLGLASGCIDIINTANAAIKGGAVDTKAWQALASEAHVAGYTAVCIVTNKAEESEWNVGDHEVIGVFTFISKDMGNPMAINGAKKYLSVGKKKAIELRDFGAACLIEIQLLRIAIFEGDVSKVLAHVSYVSGLVHSEESNFSAETKIRLLRGIAEGTKWLAIKIAREAGLKNQVMKAEAI